MAFAYIKDGKLLAVANKEVDYEDAAVTSIEVADGTEANSVFYDPDTGLVCPRMDFALSISRNLIAGIPVGTMVTDADGQDIVEDGVMEFEADVPETIWLCFDHPHYNSTWISVETGPEDE